MVLQAGPRRAAQLQASKVRRNGTAWQAGFGERNKTEILQRRAKFDALLDHFYFDTVHVYITSDSSTARGGETNYSIRCICMEDDRYWGFWEPV